jgi:hypothetical protein
MVKLQEIGEDQIDQHQESDFETDDDEDFQDEVGI